MTADPKLHRRTFLIDRDFQLKYAALMGAAGLLISAAFCVITYLVRADALSTPAISMPGDARSVDPLLVLTLAVVAALGAGALGLVGLLLTHRVAGPVYVMTQYVTALANGKYPKVRPLRRNDELKNFFERFQKALEELRQREVAEAQALDEALAALKPLSQSPEAKAAVEKLAALHDRKRLAVETRPA